MRNDQLKKIKEFLLDNLRKREEDLTKEILIEEIERIKKLIDLNNSNNGIIFDGTVSLKNIDFTQLEKEIETYFAITVNSGVLLSSKQERDFQWWSSKGKQNTDTYYWDRYKTLIKKKLPVQVVNNLDLDTDVIMDNIENPKLNTFDIRGMVVGHVQSGKTGNYSGLLCKAADAGYKFIVVIAGGMNNLRNQTQKRLNEYFVGTDNNQDLEIKKYGKSDDSKQPISLTTSKSDFNKSDADKNSLNFDNSNSPILIVIKKNVKTLTNVIKWLKSSKKKVITNHAMLLIDDESDYASVNYKEEEDPTQINSKIRELLNLFQKKSYVAYTATPFANIFIDYKAETINHGKDLFPKDFIYSLDAPSNYSGAKKYFLQNEKDGPQLIKIDDYKNNFALVQKKAFIVTELPESLKDAIRAFIINISIRYLKGQNNESNSMLIHVTRFTDVHNQVSNFVNIYFNTLKNSILSFGKLKNPELQSSDIKALKETFDKRYTSYSYTFEEILNISTTFIKEVIIREVHQKAKLPIDYKNPINVIAIGGVSLSRGYNLEGLNVSYFIRNSLFYDTLMQMARWFGYRYEYEDLCKLYIPEEIADNFARIDEAIDELNETLNEMREQEKTPEDFGLWVKFFPDTQLQVTAKNKSKDTEDVIFKINLDGIFKEKAILDIDKEKRENINNNMDLFIKNIMSKKIEFKEVNGNYLWEDIDSNLLVNFFDKISIDDDNTIIKEMLGAFPLNFIREYFEKTNEKLDVCLFSTKKNDYIITNDLIVGTQERKLERNRTNKVLKVNRRKVATAEPERVILNEEDRKDKNLTSKIIREQHMKKPLFMLHYLKEKDVNDGIVYGTFGIAFPKKHLDISNAISLKVNRVYIDKYLNSNGINDDYEE